MDKSTRYILIAITAFLGLGLLIVIVGAGALTLWLVAARPARTLAPALSPAAALPATPPVFSLDTEHRLLFDALSTPCNFAGRSDASFDDHHVMLQMEIAYQKLKAGRTTDPDLAGLYELSITGLSNAHASMLRIRSLDAREPDYAGLAQAAIKASPAIFHNDREGPLPDAQQTAVKDLTEKALSEVVTYIINDISKSEERTAYHKIYESLRWDAHMEAEKICKSLYQNVPAAPQPSLDIDLNAAWDDSFSCDTLRLRNVSGQDLTDCVLCIDHEGVDEKTNAASNDFHMHYVPRWPAGAALLLRYPSKSASGLAHDESVDFVKQLHISLYSAQCRDELNYDYEGPEAEHDIEAYWNAAKPDFYASLNSHLIDDKDVSLEMRTGFGSIPARSITLTVTRGTRSLTLEYAVPDAKWNAGQANELTISSPKLNDFDAADKIVAVLHFPHTSFSRTLTWDFRR